jgi:hypothetical protein
MLMLSAVTLSVVMESVTYKHFMLSVVMLDVVLLSVVTLSVIMLSVTFKPFMLSVVMLNVVMLSVVAPHQIHLWL